MIARIPLLRLTVLRWNIPVVAALHLTRGETFTGLVRSLGAPRESLAASLRALEAPRWISRAVGARFVLTRRGAPLGRSSAGIVAAASAAHAFDVAFRKWSLPIAAALRGWSLRFGELRACFPGITPRALAQALKEMEAAGLVEREVLHEYPPATMYRVTSVGQTFLPWLG